MKKSFRKRGGDMEGETHQPFFGNVPREGGEE